MNIRKHGFPCRPADAPSAGGITQFRLRTIEPLDAVAEPRSGGDGVTRDDPDRDEYADWEPPQRGRNAVDGDEPAGEGSSVDGDPSDDTELRAPTELPDPLPRDRIRDRLDVTPHQWYVIETLLLVSPYPVFVLLYFTVDVNENAFLTVTLLYSLVATYVGIFS